VSVDLRGITPNYRLDNGAQLLFIGPGQATTHLSQSLQLGDISCHIALTQSLLLEKAALVEEDVQFSTFQAAESTAHHVIHDLPVINRLPRNPFLT
tara:strand:- start:188 stop:475 length:288 start_codon:yes stop_codon:yes gene_type:complete